MKRYTLPIICLLLLAVVGVSNAMRGGINYESGATGSAAAAAASGASSIRPFTFVIGTAASQSVDYIGSDEKVFVAVSTTLESMGGGTFMVREGSYTFTAGSTIPWNVTAIGMGRATKIAIGGSGDFNAFVVSGTLSSMEFIIPNDYDANFVILKSSSRVLNTYASSGALSNDTQYPGPSVYLFDTQGIDMILDYATITDVNNLGTGTGTSLFSSSNSTSMTIDHWRVTNCFKSNTAPPVFNPIGGTWRITNGYFKGKGRLMVLDGASSGTLFGFNQIDMLGSPNFGTIAGIDAFGIGQQNNMNWIFNTFNDIDRNGQNIVQLQAGTDGQIRSGFFGYNTFLGMTEAFDITSETYGIVVHGNVLPSSSSVTEAGSNIIFRDNFTRDGGMYPHDTTVGN